MRPVQLAAAALIVIGLGTLSLCVGAVLAWKNWRRDAR